MIVIGTDESCNKKVKRVGVVTVIKETGNSIKYLRGEKYLRADILEDLDWVNNDVIHFNSVTKNMVALYSRKNRDYGNSFDKSLDEDGLLVAKIRLGDKLARFSQLIKMADRDETMSVEDETMIDTLIDLANYAAMTVRYLEEKQEGDSDNE